MPRKSVKPRAAWEDRFARPTVADLLQGLPKQPGSLVEHVREEVLALGGVRESVVWSGTWRWTLAYTVEGEPERPWMYIVPQPARPILAIPLTPDAIAVLPLRKLSRSVRDAIALAARVGDTAWPQWDLAGRSQTDQVLAVAKKKYELLLAPAS
jgi:hypothetical protein